MMVRSPTVRNLLALAILAPATSSLTPLSLATFGGEDDDAGVCSSAALDFLSMAMGAGGRRRSRPPWLGSLTIRDLLLLK